MPISPKARTSGFGGGLQRHADRRIGPRPPSRRAVSREVWRPHTALSPTRRERLRAPNAGLVVRPLGLETVRNQVSAIEVEARRFYEKAAARAVYTRVRQLLDDLAAGERSHQDGPKELDTEETLAQLATPLL